MRNGEGYSPSGTKSLEQARRVALSPEAGEGDYGVRKRSFRPMLKLALQHSKNTAHGFHSLPRRSLCGVRKQSFRPMLKLALQHSKNTRARLHLSHAVGEGLGVRAKNAPLFRTQ